MKPKFNFLIFIVCSLIIFVFCFDNSYSQYTDNFAASFNGTDSYIAYPSQFDISPNSAITVEAWVYPQALPTSMCVLGKNYLTGYYFGIESTGRFIFFPKPGSFLRSRAIGTVKLNQWAHIAATYDGVTTRLYLNGVQDTSTGIITGAIGVNTDSLYIGADRFGGVPSFFFNGRLDNVRIWRTVRSATQILENRFIPFNLYQQPGIYTLLTASFQFDNSPSDYSGTSFDNGNAKNISYINYNNKSFNHIDYNNNLVFNGTTDYISQFNIAGNYFNPTTSLSLECWIKRDTTGSQPGVQHIVNKSGGTSRYNYGLYVYSTGEVIFAINNGNYFIRTVPLITNSQWTHIAATYSSLTGIAKLYLNGDSVLSEGFAGNPLIENNNDSLFIGKIGASVYVADKFKGQIDEVRIWRSVRNAQQIKSYMYKHADNATPGDSLCSFDFDQIQTGYKIGSIQYISSMKIAGSTFITSAHNHNSAKLSSPMLSDPSVQFYNSSYTMSNKRFFVPDANVSGISDSIFISDGGVVNNLKAFVLMSHTYAGDIKITLTSPTGTSIDLINRKGGMGNDIMTIFSDQADSVAASDNAPLVNGPGINSPFSPGIKPEQSLSTFNGQSRTGWWKLKCFDLASLDRGYVHGWGINLIGQKALSLSALIQGFYNSSTNSMVGDTIKAFLRYPLNPYPIADSSRAILDSNGNAVFYFSNAQNASAYYIVLRHRNSIETWNSSFVFFTGGAASFNFTNANSQAYGSNQIQVDSLPSQFAIYGGDINQEGNIDLSDVVLVYNDAVSFAAGYIPTDVTGDGVTDLADIVITFNNSGNFVKVKKP